MNTFDITIVKLGVGLLLLVLANIGLGSVSAFIEKTWDWAKFRNGVIKGAIVVAALVAVYYAGYLNPDLLVVEAGGQTVNLMTAINVVLMATFAAYAIDVIKKLKDMLTNATPGSDIDYFDFAPYDVVTPDELEKETEDAEVAEWVENSQPPDDGTETE